MRLFLSAAAIFGFLSVAFGAFAAHSLKKSLDAYHFDIFQTAAQYQMYHALALMAVALLMKFDPTAPNIILYYAGWAFIFGIIIFSGSLYILSVSGIKMFGAITPIGGLSFLIGWALLFWFTLKTI